MSVREKVRSHDERNVGNTKMPLRVIYKLVSTGLYCARPAAGIVPLRHLMLANGYAMDVSSCYVLPLPCTVQRESRERHNKRSKASSPNVVGLFSRSF